MIDNKPLVLTKQDLLFIISQLEIKIDRCLSILENESTDDDDLTDDDLTDDDMDDDDPPTRLPKRR